MLSKLKEHNKQILIIILAVSVTLRILASVYIGNDVVSLPGTFDQISYHKLECLIHRHPQPVEMEIIYPQIQ